MWKHSILLFVLLFICVMVSAEKEIEECNQKEIELQVSQQECSKNTAKELDAKKERDTRETEYNKAVKEFDLADGYWQVATKEENAAKIAHHSDLAVLNTIKATEDRLCNKLVRNVENGTPCAHLLQQARENNRLHACREAKVTLKLTVAREAASRAVFDKNHAATSSRLAQRIAMEQLKDAAFERVKSARAIWTLRHTTQASSCSRYNNLKIIFNGSNKVKRVSRVCKTTNECVNARTKCVKNHTIPDNCVAQSHAYTCVNWANGVCRMYHTKSTCLRRAPLTYCIKYALECTQRKEKKICARVFRKSRVEGPKSCSSSQQLAFRKEGKKLIRFCKTKETDKRKEIVCQSTYDPYIHSFKKQYYSLTSEGDYELYTSHDSSVEVHTRVAMLPTNPSTVNTKAAIVLNGVDIISHDCRTQTVSVNGVPTTAFDVTLPNGGTFRNFHGHMVEMLAPNGDKISTRMNGWSDDCWLNVYVFSKNTNGGGLCYADSKKVEDYRITGLFKHFELPRESRSAIANAQQGILAKVTPLMQSSAVSACDIPKLPAALKKQCQQDLLLSTEGARKSIIAGYEQLINDELRGHFDNSNFFAKE